MWWWKQKIEKYDGKMGGKIGKLEKINGKIGGKIIHNLWKCGVTEK